MLFAWILLITSAIAAEYDYIIVGGGTSGLVVANRLSEDPNISVLVIEGGDSVYDNPYVTDISRLASTYDSPLDWAFQTTEQAYGGRRQIIRTGKALGGTNERLMHAQSHRKSMLSNGLGSMGGHGIAEVSAGATFAPRFHGFHGPVNVGFRPMSKGENDLTTALNRALSTSSRFIRIPYPDDIRSDAARAYYWPYKDRPNLHLKLDTLVTRLLWSDKNGDDGLRSEGVETYESKHGKRYASNARREAILAAGAMRSPALLELSGAGNPSLDAIPSRVV
ncbi:FAD/NAD(P)-binding domain-containing protein [Aspergillus affinis]|uniref:FAD/NAD(P)-binding domain-containing protein n=1 Tax=Aspergillus affinis TaxID=1070780 RepID=UPI0022FEA02E|nr:FAD/NAD(P)-binding domain-containing protein [Aspergillus affinis]KAI9035072.1 FAD/NAD(P)-binding domain-containing protein [Aspergillus affinis]